jgi:predicted ferric reductase
VFLVIHIASSVLDGFVPIRWLDAVVPFGAAYRPFWLGLGALSLDVFIALAVTSLVRRHVGHRVWRAIHWSAYACWLLAMVHSIGAGSDSGQTWMILIYLGCGAAVACALLFRLVATARGAVGAGPAAVGARPVGPVPLTATQRQRGV